MILYIYARSQEAFPSPGDRYAGLKHSGSQQLHEAGKLKFTSRTGHGTDDARRERDRCSGRLSGNGNLIGQQSSRSRKSYLLP